MKRTLIILLVAIVATSCNKYELLEGCLYQTEIRVSKPVNLTIGHQKQQAFIAEAKYFLPEGAKIHVKSLHNNTMFWVNGVGTKLKHKGDEVWVTTSAESYLGFTGKK